MLRYKNICAGLVISIMALPAAAWERTTQTKIAPDGTPLVQMIAERGDVLGEPWLEYLILDGRDVSGNWWLDSAQTLLDYNPNGWFAPKTNYGILAGSVWWLPDLEAIQATVTTNDTAATDANPVMLQSDFVALSGAFANDIAGIQQFQQQSEAKLNARLEALESGQSANTESIATMAAMLSTTQQAQSDMVSVLGTVTEQVGVLQTAVDGIDTKIATAINLETTAISNDIATKTSAIEAKVNWFVYGLLGFAAAFLLAGIALWLYVDQRFKQLRNEQAATQATIRATDQQVECLAELAKGGLARPMAA